MKKVDYIIVGFGIAGASLCEHLLQRGKDFVVIDDMANGATHTAGGVVNPVVLKRFTLAWNAKEFLAYAAQFYQKLETRLSSEFLKNTPVFRIFSNYEEQNQWLVATDKLELSPFLESEVYDDQQVFWNNPFGYGKVREAFQIETKKLLYDFGAFLKNDNFYRDEVFDYHSLEINSNEIRYRDLRTVNIIFAEGARALSNPFFPKQAILPKKGEYITIHAPKLKLDAVIKGPFFVIPLGEQKYKVGATFAHDDYSEGTSAKGMEQLTKAIQKMIKVPFEVIHQEMGFRPTVKDRKPILGNLQNFENAYFMNGLGARGLMMAPLLAKILIQYSEEKDLIPDEINIRRFIK